MQATLAGVAVLPIQELLAFLPRLAAVLLVFLMDIVLGTVISLHKPRSALSAHALLQPTH